MNLVLLISGFASLTSGLNTRSFDRFCEGHSKCYTLWSDPYTFTFWNLPILAYMHEDCYLPPYVSWAESIAMIATFQLHYLQKWLLEKTDVRELVSAAHILLSLHTNSYDNSLFTCTEPNMWGSFAMYFSLDMFLYNEWDITFGVESSNWCDYASYQWQLDHWNGRVRYNYDYQEFEDNGLTYAKLAEWFWMHGLAVTNVPYCPEMILGSWEYNEEKYVCDPETQTVQWGTVVIFGVMEDYDGIWYAAYFMEATSANDRLLWIRPWNRNYNETLQYFSYVLNSKSYWGGSDYKLGW